MERFSLPAIILIPRSLDCNNGGFHSRVPSTECRMEMETAAGAAEEVLQLPRKLKFSPAAVVVN